MEINAKTRGLAAHAMEELTRIIADSKHDFYALLDFVTTGEELGLDRDTSEERTFWVGILNGLADAHDIRIDELLEKLGIPVPEPPRP